MTIVIRSIQHLYLYYITFLKSVFCTNCQNSSFFFAVSCGLRIHSPRSFLTLVIIVVSAVSIAILKGVNSHLFHSSMVWEQTLLYNGSLLRSLPAFCECAVAVDLFGSYLKWQNKEFTYQNAQQPTFWNRILWHCIFKSANWIEEAFTLFPGVIPS